MAADTCPSCGRPLDLHDRHIRFTLPDPVRDMPDWEEAPGTWMSHEDADGSVMMVIPDAGPFVRALLPVRLTDGHTITFGVWLLVHPSDLQHTFDVWWGPEYRDLRINGWLANAIEPWSLLAAPVEAAVRNVEETPYCEHSSDPDLDRVLREEWPHEAVFNALMADEVGGHGWAP